MNNNKRRAKILAIVFLLSTSLTAQTGEQNRVSTVFAVLTKSLESKSATAGQELSLRTISDVMTNGAVVIPRGSRLVGHISEVATKGKDEPQSVLAIVIDKAVTTGGREIPL